jgi:DNA modification methylase
MPLANLLGKPGPLALLAAHLGATQDSGVQPKGLSMQVPNMVQEIQLWDLDKLMPYVGNPRVHSRKQVGQIAASMRKYGVVAPAVVDPQGNLIIGHGRILAARQLQLKVFPVVVVDHLTEIEVRGLRIADNRIAENSTWDESLLSAELAALLESQVDMESLGFDGHEVDQLLAKLEPESGLIEDDVIPEPPASVVTLAGDMWLLEEHRILCGDSTILSTVEGLLGADRADLILADPPYNVQYQRGAGPGARPILNDDLGKQFGRFLSDACGVMMAVAAGAIYIFMSSSELHTLYRAFTEAGGHWSTFLIWGKDVFTLGRADYQRQYEPILYGWRAGSQHYWCGARDLSDLWLVDRQRVNDLHPTMKPVELVERAIRHSSRVGAVVLDPFGGAGSTLIACQKTGRRARMVELDPHYVDVMVTRWQAFTGKTARLAGTGQSFAERQQQVEKQ